MFVYIVDLYVVTILGSSVRRVEISNVYKLNNLLESWSSSFWLEIWIFTVIEKILKSSQIFKVFVSL